MLVVSEFINLNQNRVSVAIYDLKKAASVLILIYESEQKRSFENQ